MTTDEPKAIEDELKELLEKENSWQIIDRKGRTIAMKSGETILIQTNPQKRPTGGHFR